MILYGDKSDVLHGWRNIPGAHGEDEIKEDKFEVGQSIRLISEEFGKMLDGDAGRSRGGSGKIYAREIAHTLYLRIIKKGNFAKKSRILFFYFLQFYYIMNSKCSGHDIARNKE